MTTNAISFIKLRKRYYCLNREKGSVQSSVWIIGDSEPDNCSDKLEDPFDTKHPTIHNIFFPILEHIQDDLFFTGNRIDVNKFYIRNAVKNSQDWKNEAVLENEILEFKQLMTNNPPKMILTFGGKAYEFVRRSMGEKFEKLDHWDTINLGTEFARSCKTFDINKVNVIPLLHASICRGKYLTAHENFSKAINEKFGLAENNYFEATAKVLTPIFLENRDAFDVWKEPDKEEFEATIKYKYGCVRNHSYYSDDKKYRYLLKKIWDDSLPSATFIGINPSDATELIMDRTVMNVTNFLIKKGYGSVNLLNLFAYRSKDPKKLKDRSQDYERTNEKYLEELVSESDLVIVGWGKSFESKHKGIIAKAKKILKKSTELKCFQDQNGEYNRHPRGMSNQWELVDYIL